MIPRICGVNLVFLSAHSIDFFRCGKAFEAVTQVIVTLRSQDICDASDHASAPRTAFDDCAFYISYSVSKMKIANVQRWIDHCVHFIFLIDLTKTKFICYKPCSLDKGRNRHFEMLSQAHRRAVRLSKSKVELILTASVQKMPVA